MTPWILFTIFFFGPCEPLIPLLIYPAAQGHAWQIATVSLAFGATTVSVMTVLVALLGWGVGRLTVPVPHGYGHAASGLVVSLCGLAVILGL